jgi:Na+/H+ antiporter NhaC
MSEDDNMSDKDDRLIQRYDTILKESALLTTFSGILFGFLLNISLNTPRNFALIDTIVTLLPYTLLP